MNKTIVIGGGAAGMMAAVLPQETVRPSPYMNRMKTRKKAFYHRKGQM